MREYYSGAVLDFIYDADGRPYALKYNGTVYYYILNLQGDVIRLVNASGATVASYEYDPYGKILSATGSMAEINPLRYRGYYYDEEIGLYYLQSRYYDPQTGRFLNQDKVFDNDAGFPGFNLFVYCGNNPINRVDISGADSEKLDDLDLADDEVQERGGGGDNRGGFLRPYFPPNGGFAHQPTQKTLPKGTLLQRTGGTNGRYVAPAGTPKEMLSLPYNTAQEYTSYYQVLKPINVLSGTALPWFGQIGGGTQYYLLDGNVQFLIDTRYITVWEK